MKNIIRIFLYKLTGINSIRLALNPMVYLQEFFFKLFIFRNKNRILSGKFKNIQFFKNVRGSEFKPKYFGTYEDELNIYFDLFSGSTLIDIGCDDGYYSIGLFMNNFVSKVYAFEYNRLSINNFKRNLVLNNLTTSNILLVENFVSDFSSLSYYLNNKENFLIKCDIQGSEYSLFSENMIENLSSFNCSFIIETHLKEEDELKLIMLFEKYSFFVKIVNRKINKQYLEKFNFLNTIFTKIFRKYWLNEHRPDFNRWIIVSKNNF
jgi:precorrin-6B methylase 2